MLATIQRHVPLAHPYHIDWNMFELNRKSKHSNKPNGIVVICLFKCKEFYASVSSNPTNKSRFCNLEKSYGSPKKKLFFINFSKNLKNLSLFYTAVQLYLCPLTILFFNCSNQSQAKLTFERFCSKKEYGKGIPCQYVYRM